MIRTLIQPVYDQDGIQLEGLDTQLADGVIAPDAARTPLEQLWASPSSLHLLTHGEQTSRKSNPFEAGLIASILERGVSLGVVQPASVAVMTPHRAQRAMLEQLLEPLSEYITVIDTVERLQGGEQDTIIVSATVSDPVAMAQSEKFVLDLQRANVAFSRTRKRLFVVASQVIFDHVPAEVDVYSTAKLWKHLRHLCSTTVTQWMQGDVEVLVLRP